MAESKIAKTVGEAQVGDLLWLHDSYANRYDAARRYQGRGTWALATVMEVGRLSVVTGDRRYPGTANKFDRKTGAMRGRASQSTGLFVRGADERAADWWPAQSWTLAELVRGCRDVEILKAINHTLGREGPPDYSVAPSPVSTREG